MNYKEAYTGSGLPALMVEGKDGTASFISNGPLETGDTYEMNRFSPQLQKTTQRSLMIAEIIESRPAKGSWSGRTWDGINPVWTLARVL